MPGGQLAIALLAAAETLRISVPTVVDGWLGRADRAQCDARLRAWASRLIREAGISLELEGTFPRGGPFVVMSNHQSMYDIPVMYRIYPACLRMVAKRELFAIPIWGRAMTAAEFIAIDRSNRERAQESLRIAKQRLGEGVHIWISPEGTRSPARELGPFKRGGFRLAVAASAPILPITVDGTHHVMPKGAWTVSRGRRVRVTVHDVVDPRSYGFGSEHDTVPLLEPADGAEDAEALAALMADVRRRIASGLRAG